MDEISLFLYCFSFILIIVCSDKAFYPFNFFSRYSFSATALLNLSSLALYSSVIDDSSFALSRIISTDALFLSNCLKYLSLNWSHFFSSCANHFLNELLGAISFSHKAIFTLSLLKPRGHNLSTSILKLLSPFGLSYILSTWIFNSNIMCHNLLDK